MSQRLARSLVFSTSASVLVIEILAVRILAPYLGVSLEVFTGIIGVVLAGISIGAWLGGKAADRTDPRALIGPLLVSGGMASIASLLLVDLVGPALSTGPVSIVLASTIGFFAPAALLSAVPPVVVKVRLSDLGRTGSVVGSYSAIGTAGAIFGTFLTGFVLIASFPTRPIVVGLGGALTITGLLSWRPGVTKTGPLTATLAILGATALLMDGPCNYETTYHCAIVETDRTRPSGRTLVLDRVRNSYVDLVDPTHLEFRYVQLIADVIESQLPEGPLNVVSVGGGGFTLPRYLSATRPGSHNTVLEIDGELIEIARRHLDLRHDVEVVVEDARISLRDLADGHADVVIGDAFSGASVPWHLTTLEFTREIERLLAAGGVYTMNVIDYGEREFARSAARTLLEVFANVAVLAPPSYLHGPDGGNFVLVASNSPIDLSTIEARARSRGSTEIAIAGPELGDFIDGASPLSDDFAPVDQMLGHS